MLELINRRYLIFGPLLYVVVLLLNPADKWLLVTFNFLVLVSFGLVVHNLLGRPDAFYTKKKLALITFLYTGIVAFIYNLLSWYYTDNLYIFSEADAVLYHNESEVMSGMSLAQSISYYLSRHELEDLGIVLILSTLYRIVVSKIMLTLFYLLVAVFTAKGMFSISRRFMSDRYSFLCTVVYCFSSYVLWFHASGLKESVLVMLIVQFYNQYYQVLFDKKSVSVWLLVAIALSLLLFRPVLSIFCLVSLSMGVVFGKKKSGFQLLFLLIVVAGGIYFLETIRSSTDKFLLGGTESMLEIKQMEGLVKGSVSFTYLVNTLSSMFGPFPGVLSSKPHLMFFAPGLVFKAFLSVAFWFGFIHVIRTKTNYVYPLLFFTIIEMVSLTYILEALELRKSLPHFPLVYIVAFIFIYKFDQRQLLTVKNHLLYKKTFQAASLVLCFLMVYWNFR